eukprot:m.32027 g.32027  ORF g.32027 m.32027 type:complete len:568 (-) comp8372_c0_seq1:747-2450(-)
MASSKVFVLALLACSILHVTGQTTYCKQWTPGERTPGSWCTSTSYSTKFNLEPIAACKQVCEDDNRCMMYSYSEKQRININGAISYSPSQCKLREYASCSKFQYAMWLSHYICTGGRANITTSTTNTLDTTTSTLTKTTMTATVTHTTTTKTTTTKTTTKTTTTKTTATKSTTTKTTTTKVTTTKTSRTSLTTTRTTTTKTRTTTTKTTMTKTATTTTKTTQTVLTTTQTTTTKTTTTQTRTTTTKTTTTQTSTTTTRTSTTNTKTTTTKSTTTESTITTMTVTTTTNSQTMTGTTATGITVTTETDTTMTVTTITTVTDTTQTTVTSVTFSIPTDVTSTTTLTTTTSTTSSTKASANPTTETDIRVLDGTLLVRLEFDMDMQDIGPIDEFVTKTKELMATIMQIDIKRIADLRVFEGSVIVEADIIKGENDSEPESQDAVILLKDAVENSEFEVEVFGNILTANPSSFTLVEPETTETTPVSSSNSDDQLESNKDDDSLSPGAIAGISIGAVIFIVLLLVALLWWGAASKGAGRGTKTIDPEFSSVMHSNPVYAQSLNLDASASNL